tara:strand:+ start:570 stop:830 length:261 start_codon:yes stop_codon:yes gene_type:complete
MAIFKSADDMLALAKQCRIEIAEQNKSGMWFAMSEAARRGEDYLTNITYEFEIDPKLERELREHGFKVEIKGVYNCVQRWHITWRE